MVGRTHYRLKNTIVPNFDHSTFWITLWSCCSKHTNNQSLHCHQHSIDTMSWVASKPSYGTYVLRTVLYPRTVNRVLDFSEHLTSFRRRCLKLMNLFQNVAAPIWWDERIAQFKNCVVMNRFTRGAYYPEME